MLRRPLAAACAAAALALPAHAVAASASARPCTPAKAPTRARAWRAYVPAGTPLRARVAARDAGAPLPLTLDAGWRLVLEARRAPGHDGACLLRVRLDRRPNTAAAWVAATRVRLAPTPWRIEVRRATRRATLLHAGRAVARWRVVVGKPSTPTPTGTFAIQGVYRTPPASFSGAWILALSAHSDVLATFDGGDGQVALHGRGGASLLDPLGTAASHGCVRFDNAAIGAIVRRVGRTRLPGTPVAIR